MDEFLSVAAVARRLGIAPATLRTWDRRYGVGPSVHEAGHHRRYSETDLATLMFMKHLVVSGSTPADAAKRALSHDGQTVVSTPARRRKSATNAHQELVRAVLRAAQSLDGSYIEAALSAHIKKHGALDTWKEVVVPLLNKIGENWERTEKGVEEEHLVSEILKRIFHVSEVKKPKNSRPVVLAAIAEEQHSLVLYALKAALGERGISVQFLGARTPLDAVAGCVRRLGPPAVFLWACMSENADQRFIRDLPKVRPAPRIIVGGPGWDPSQCEGAVFVPDLEAACHEITQAVGVHFPR